VVRQGGPLAGKIPPGVHLTQCIPVRSGGIVVVEGFGTIPNSGQQVAVIDRVAFASPRNLQQLAAYVVPSVGLYGDGTGYPPHGGGHQVAGFDWAGRQNAAGARIAHPTPAKPNMDLVVIARMADANDASEQGVDVWYHVGNQHYHLRTNVTMLDRTQC
jgi:hypothetical protein